MRFFINTEFGGAGRMAYSSKQSPIIKDVLSLVVTCQGKRTIQELIESCLFEAGHLVSRILVIDNNSSDKTVEKLQCYRNGLLSVFEMSSNVGVAAAYNLGLERARHLGVHWLFILDQDSVCRKGLLAQLLKTSSSLEGRGRKVGAVCPTVRSIQFPEIVHLPYIWGSRGFSPVRVSRTSCDALVRIDSCLTSGTLYNVEALRSVQGFREDYFIDFVDHECHLRLRRQGWEIWWDGGCELFHRLGRRQKQTEQGLWVEHNPERYYYMARNMLDGHWRFGGWRASTSFLRGMLKHMGCILRHGEEPMKSFYYILKGILDAFLGHFGPLDSKS
jgi:rhamnosyltransferase